MSSLTKQRLGDVKSWAWQCLKALEQINIFKRFFPKNEDHFLCVDLGTPCPHYENNDVVMFFFLQVISGGNYDVDVILYDESGKTLYTVQKKQYDSYSFTAQTEGVYKFCFSNEFSTFSHKVVYFDFQAGDETPLTKDMGAHHTALTQMETACVTIHEDLKVCNKPLTNCL